MLVRNNRKDSKGQPAGPITFRDRKGKIVRLSFGQEADLAESKAVKMYLDAGWLVEVKPGK